MSQPAHTGLGLFGGLLREISVKRERMRGGGGRMKALCCSQTESSVTTRLSLLLHTHRLFMISDLAIWRVYNLLKRKLPFRIVTVNLCLNS